MRLFLKKLTLFVAVSLFVVSHASISFCVQINILENLKNRGKKSSVVYEQKWGIVYDAVKIVWDQSENINISNMYKMFLVEYAPNEKAIFAFRGNSKAIGVFFEPLSDNRTNVDFMFYGDSLQSTIDNSIEELTYLLKHGYQAYLRYTCEKEFQRKKEEEARHNSFFE
jgi:hypothetical protein